MALQTLTDEEFLSAEADDNKKVTFTRLEWKYFVLELKDMLAKGEFDILKAMHNARYLAGLERSIKQFDEGKVVTFTPEQWEAFVNEQDLH